MTDWASQIARGRRMAEALLWLASAALVALVMAMGTALALWLPQAPGQDVPAQEIMVIDLTPLPPSPLPTEARPPAPPAPEPEPVPEPAPEPQPEPAPQPQPQPPEPVAEPAPVAEPQITPAPDPAIAAPATRPLPRPDRSRTATNAAAPAPQTKAKAKAQTAKKAKPPAKAADAAPPAPASSAAPARGAADADALAAWKSKVGGQLARHLRRKSYGSAPARLTVTLRIDGGGNILGVSVVRSSGNAAVDGKVAAALLAKGAVAPPPGGHPVTPTLPLRVN